MDVYIKISVRHPEWFANGVDQDYREQWEAINKGKVPEYGDGVSFKITGGVAGYTKDMSGSYTFRFFSESGQEEIVLQLQTLMQRNLSIRMDRAPGL
jgi:hypothetical protein